ncbi:Glucose-methanol-choline oxidoreductase [Moelleriella libera RCEF 2490]|uniref:Glucose-methanol-choline oxidoreductase n=1 Tax=Moelleriella libera RCEF 2490 TaxID=1081109 RepID=A0A166V2R1_9HYPO|nr:Glucose-methanol-choline oxidoreductase [Moelleriella libera RCEF 2490]
MRCRHILPLLLAASTSLAARQLDDYEYVVVGSGAGGGPLAARLALAGHKTLLIEAGDDQGSNYNYSVPAYSALASEDERLAWNFFVRHYADDERQSRDYKASYDTPDGGIYTGRTPPPGSRLKGTLYPRTNTLGGCTAHNALITIYPHRSDFDAIARLTGDQTWAAVNMRKYFKRLEKNNYLSLDIPGHGHDGWLSVEQPPITIALKDQQLLNLVTAGAAVKGRTILDLITGDANNEAELRDVDGGVYQIPVVTRKGVRNGPREFVLAVRDAKNKDGTKQYPLDVRTSCHVTKVVFDKAKDRDQKPRATGVEFLDGAYLYRASPRANRDAGAGRGTPGCRGSGRRRSSRGSASRSWPTCAADVLGDRGSYASPGFAAAIMHRTGGAAEYDTFVFGGPVNFRGYFPRYSVNITERHDQWTWAVLKNHPRNNAGRVTLRSADPLDVPDIVFNYFDTGSGEYRKDLDAIAEAIGLARTAFKASLTPSREILPGPDVTTRDAVDRYIMDTAWGHHASCTCPIGADGDPMAVLDSSFRVRGVAGLRVVDASVFPRIPGSFTALSTYMVSEKAAEVILEQLEKS